ncbi:hypothetical protein AK830_g3166 [Neonectria ditissima]|uniref:Uncharacterized protein n=1 Tax=Neonectria ditissima TaxID=78410 RepID=A0A0P7BPS8_9HYPO|nr:hypothetical protein AK830_g3166 [Neonectria ditissima]
MAFSCSRGAHASLHCASDGSRTLETQDEAQCYSDKSPMRKAAAEAGSAGQYPGPSNKRHDPGQASGQEDYYARYRRANTTTTSSSPPFQSSPFTPEDQLYLHHRLPIQQPATAQTVRLHFARLSAVYQGLADRCLARAAAMSPGLARERRRRMGVLATALAARYRGCSVVLSDGFVDAVLARHAGIRRPSRFWERVLDEVEIANASWSFIRLWILICITQSIIIILASTLLAPAAQTALAAANVFACMWYTTVLWEKVHARYFAAKADEQELHDLMGGL